MVGETSLNTGVLYFCNGRPPSGKVTIDNPWRSCAIWCDKFEPNTYNRGDDFKRVKRLALATPNLDRQHNENQTFTVKKSLFQGFNWEGMIFDFRMENMGPDNTKWTDFKIVISQNEQAEGGLVGSAMTILKGDDGRQIPRGEPMPLYRADNQVIWQEKKGNEVLYDWLRVYYATEQPPVIPKKPTPTPSGGGGAFDPNPSRNPPRSSIKTNEKVSFRRQELAQPSFQMPAASELEDDDWAPPQPYIPAPAQEPTQETAEEASEEAPINGQADEGRQAE